MVTALLLAGCAHTDRPEAVVERWLNSLNQGAAGRPDSFAKPAISNSVLQDWQRCDPGAIDVVEVGRAVRLPATATGFRHDSAIVPYRLEFASNLESLCGRAMHSTAPTHGWAVARALPTGWIIVALDSAREIHLLGGPRVPPVPSEGGRPIVSPSAVIWLIGLLVGLVLCALVALLMRTMPKPAPLSSGPPDPNEARGL